MTMMMLPTGAPLVAALGWLILASPLLEVECFSPLLRHQVADAALRYPAIKRRTTAPAQLLPTTLSFFDTTSRSGRCPTPTTALFVGNGEIFIVVNDDDENWDDEEDDEEDEEEEEDVSDDPYIEVAATEFSTSPSSKASSSSDLALTSDSNALVTTVDWGGALGKLRQRVEDLEEGKSGNPSHALFRVLSSESPNQSIGSFLRTAKPQIVQAMSGAISSLLGGLSSPQSGVELVVKATGDKIGSLCFQLQMTGYMFRNVEYVIALKDLLQLRGTATLQDYKDAFERLDSDDSGFIEAEEVQQLFDDVYGGKTPPIEIMTFMKFFDQNKDGRISWGEFERGLGAAIMSSKKPSALRNMLPEHDDDDDHIAADLDVSGTLTLELDNGKVIEVDAKEYVDNLKREAKALKEAIAREKGIDRKQDGFPSFLSKRSPEDEFGGIAGYIASRQGDVKALTEGISPDIVDTMKLLVDFVLEGGESAKGKNVPKNEMEIELPGSALQQLALWQLVLGYKLREAEATGEYLKLLE